MGVGDGAASVIPLTATAMATLFTKFIFGALCLSAGGEQWGVRGVKEKRKMKSLDKIFLLIGARKSRGYLLVHFVRPSFVPR